MYSLAEIVLTIMARVYRNPIRMNWRTESALPKSVLVQR